MNIAPLSTSPAFNGAVISRSSPSHDQRGFLRDGSPDIGAIEIVPMVITVTNLDSEGEGSLASAIDSASSGDTIIFEPALSGGSIQWSYSDRDRLINKDLVIDASGWRTALTFVAPGRGFSRSTRSRR